MVRRTSNKLLSGITLAVIKKYISRDSAEYYEQNSAELYAILDKKGWRFHNDRQMWVERKYPKRKPPAVQIMKSPVPATVQEKSRGIVALMRVIAPQPDMDYILNSVQELIPALDGQVVSVSKPYANQESGWQRVYLKVIFNRSISRD